MAVSQKQRARDSYEAWAAGRAVVPWARLSWEDRSVWRTYIRKLVAQEKATDELTEARLKLEAYKKSYEPS
jgi:hypothetical protein